MIALMTTEDVATSVKVAAKTVQSWIKKGAKGKKLKAHRLPSGEYRIDPSDLSDFLGFDLGLSHTIRTTGKH